MKRRIFICFTCFFFCTQAGAETKIYAEKDNDLRTFGDQMMVALPASAALGSLAIGDLKGVGQLSLGLGSSQLMVEIFKKSIDKERPDHSGSHESFPSGHAASAFSGAAYLQLRYGNVWAIPAYSLAGIVAYSRVDANKHDLDDVVASANISVLNGLLFTTEFTPEDALYIRPFYHASHVGLTLSYKLNQGKHQSQQKSLAQYQHEYEFSIGGQQYLEHFLASSTADDVSLKPFSSLGAPTVFTVSKLTLHINHSFYYRWVFIPFEVRNDGVLPQDLSFQGEHYLQGESIVQSIQDYTMRQHFYYDLALPSIWIIQTGLGLGVAYSNIRMDNAGGDKYTKHNSFYYWPEAMIALGMRLTQDLSIMAEFQGGLSDKVKEARTHLSLRYALTRKWDIKASFGLEQKQRALTASDQNVYDQISHARYGVASVVYLF